MDPGEPGPGSTPPSLLPRNREEAMDLLCSVRGDSSLLSIEQRAAIQAVWTARKEAGNGNGPVTGESSKRILLGPVQIPPERKEGEYLRVRELVRKDVLADVLKGADDETAYLTGGARNEQEGSPLTDAEVTETVDKAINEAIRLVTHLNDVRVKVRLNLPKTLPNRRSIERYYVNDPYEGILLQSVMTTDYGGKSDESEFIFSFYLDEVSRVVNPVDPLDESYSVVFRNPKLRDQVISFGEAQLADIIATVAKNRPGVRNRQRVHEAISSLIGEFDNQGKVKVERKIPATGFFTDGSGELAFGVSRRLKANLPEPDRMETVRALEALEELLAFYSTGPLDKPGAADHVLSALYFAVQAPLSLIRKQNGLEAKILLLHGEPHTGKTYLCRIISHMFGIQESQGMIGAARITPPQLANHLSRTTFPVVLDEVRNALSDPGIADMLKTSTTSLLVKERILARSAFRVQSFYAFAAVIATTNFIPDLYTGLRDRLIPVEFTVAHRKSQAEADAFEKAVNRNRTQLAYIGSYLCEFYRRHWPTVQRLILNNDQVSAGYEILGLVYRDLGIPAPSWLRPVSVPEEIVADDPVQVLFDFMAEMYMKQLRQVTRIGDIPFTWNERLNHLKETNNLPSFTANITKSNITLRGSVLREVAREKGIEIPGGLNGVACRIGSGAHTSKQQGSHVLVVPRFVFEDRVTPKDGGQEMIEVVDHTRAEV